MHFAFLQGFVIRFAGLLNYVADDILTRCCDLKWTDCCAVNISDSEQGRGGPRGWRLHSWPLPWRLTMGSREVSLVVEFSNTSVPFHSCWLRQWFYAVPPVSASSSALYLSSLFRVFHLFLLSSLANLCPSSLVQLFIKSLFVFSLSAVLCALSFYLVIHRFCTLWERRHYTST